MLSGASAFIRHTRAREQLWPLRDHWADNSRGRSAPTPSLVCHFVLDAPLSLSMDRIRSVPADAVHRQAQKDDLDIESCHPSWRTTTEDITTYAVSYTHLRAHETDSYL